MLSILLMGKYKAGRVAWLDLVKVPSAIAPKLEPRVSSQPKVRCLTRTSLC